MFKPCLLIPVYNHERAIPNTLARLRPFGLPCILVDDGSNADCAAVLDQLAANGADWITLVRRPRNGGKGAAAKTGFIRASELGYTHALQIDADGQHDCADVPRLLDAARAEPDALISGRPIFGADIPAIRFYGRYLTHTLVWLETLSFDIMDSMCGFRVYPLGPVRRLMAHHYIGDYMDFDTDIMVRLYWAGSPVRHVPTQVRYPEDGVSHFRMVRDNIRMTVLHIRLVFGMLWRVPLLLWRKVNPNFANDKPVL